MKSFWIALSLGCVLVSNLGFAGGFDEPSGEEDKSHPRKKAKLEIQASDPSDGAIDPRAIVIQDFLKAGQEDIFRRIISLLPMKDIKGARLVCREWRNMCPLSTQEVDLFSDAPSPSPALMGQGFEQVRLTGWDLPLSQLETYLKSPHLITLKFAGIGPITGLQKGQSTFLAEPGTGALHHLNLGHREVPEWLFQKIFQRNSETLETVYLQNNPINIELIQALGSLKVLTHLDTSFASFPMDRESKEPTLNTFVAFLTRNKTLKSLVISKQTLDVLEKNKAFKAFSVANDLNDAPLKIEVPVVKRYTQPKDKYAHLDLPPNYKV